MSTLDRNLPLDATTQPVRIGTDYEQGLDVSWVGGIDELWVHDVSFSDAQIRSIFEGNLPPDNGLAHWTADNTTLDVVGGRQSSIVGSGFSFGPGHNGQAFWFDESPRPYLLVDGTGSWMDFGTGPFTFHAWVLLQPNSRAGNVIIARARDCCPYEGWGWYVQNNVLALGGVGAWGTPEHPAHPFPLNVWTHVAVTRVTVDDTLCVSSLDPLSMGISSRISVFLFNSQVSFNAYVNNQTSSANVQLGTTTITFGSGSPIDFPVRMYEQMLLSGSCEDNYQLVLPVAEFVQYLNLQCLDSQNNQVDCANPSSCTLPPCHKHWSSEVTIERQSTISVGSSQLPSTSSSNHIVSLSMPWIISTNSSVVRLIIPELSATSAITQINFNITSQKWTIVVTSTLPLPYQLFAQPGVKIAGINYTVTPCSGDPCLQEISFEVEGCDISQIFTGSQAFNNLELECTVYDASCSLAPGTRDPASLSVTLNVGSQCDTSSSTGSTGFTQTDISFTMTGSDFTGSTGSFVENDEVNFAFNILKELPEATISSITVVSFKEPTYHPGINFAVTTTTIPTNPCANPGTLCFNFDSSQLTNLPDSPSVVVTLVSIVQVEFTGLKRATDLRNFMYSVNVTIQQSQDEPELEPESTGSHFEIPILLPLLLQSGFYFNRNAFW
jgi:hypothetical protein